MGSRLRVLLYHDLESPEYPNEKQGDATRDTVVGVQDFERQVRFLYENGYRTITFGDYFRLREARGEIPQKRVVITFDDGHYSNYCLAFEILRKYRFKGVFFIVADRVGRDCHLTADQIREMAEAGMEIGSHGLSHAYLPLLKPHEIRKELVDSRRILESIIRRPVEYFAFPGGHYDRNILKELQAAGYKGACSCIQGTNGLNSDPYLLRRLEIRNRCTVDNFSKISNPLTMAFHRFIDMFKRFLKQMTGIEQYSKLRLKLYKFYPFKR